MSEAERKRRLDYKKNRKKWMLIQAIIIAVVAAVVFGSFITYYQLSKTFYIEYTESSEIDYFVKLKPNEFYGEGLLEKGRAYPTALIETIVADFEYELNMGEENVEYEYSYSIDAQVRVEDKESGAVIFDPVYELKSEAVNEHSGNSKLTIKELITLDFNKYNDIAKNFVDSLGFKNMTSRLLVTMNISVTGSCDSFEENSANVYSTAMSIPLTEETVEINVTSSAPSGESRVLACGTKINENIFKIIAIVCAILDALLIAGLIVFAYITRNEDINYSIRVKKLLNNYRSYIQRITNEFDMDGYQILFVNTFNEMLGIRDTIQSPILMHENEDQTKSSFMIPTNTKILYLFEVKVDNYDLIYAEPEIEEPVIIEEVNEEDLAEALATPDIDLEEIDFVDEVDEAYNGDKPGVDVIGVVWPERAHRNKVYRYDPNGEDLDDGDIVLVPTRDAAKGKDVIRKAAVAHGNHKVAPETLKHPLKKIIGVVKRKAEKVLSGVAEGDSSCGKEQ